MANSTGSRNEKIKTEMKNEEYGSIGLDSDSDVEADFPAVVRGIKYEDTNVQAEQIETIRIAPPILPEIQEIPITEQSLRDETFVPSFCRLCAIPSGDMIYIFGSTILHKSMKEKIQRCLPITVRETDNLSKKVCRLCLQKLESCYQFRMTVMKAEKQLLVFYEQSKRAEETRIHCQTSSQDKKQLLVRKTADNAETLTREDADANDIESDDFSDLGEDSESRNSSSENQNTEPFTEILNSGRSSASENDQDVPYAALDSPISEVHAKGESVSDSVNYSPRNIKKQSNSRLKSRLTPAEESSYSLRERKPIKYNSDNEDGLSSDETIDGHAPAAQNVGCQSMKCHICKAGLQTIEECHTHARSHASTNYYPCCFCDEILETEPEWEEHWSRHEDLDSKPFKRQRIIGVHEKQETSSGDISEKQFKNNEESNADEKKKLFKCWLCNRSFSSIDLKAKHGKICLESNRKHACDHCEKVFSKKSYLRIHMLIHAGERPFSCDFCPMSFRLKEYRDVHRRIHTGERPFRCDFCPKSFRIKRYRTDHLRVHTGERPYICPICGKTFAVYSSLKTHRDVHSGKISGSTCGENLESTGNINAVIKKYKCGLCEARFAWPSGLRKHKRTFHKKSD